MNATIWGRWVSRLFQQRRRPQRPQSAQRRLLFETLEDRVTPTTFIWTGLGSNNNWSTGANWQGGVAPTTSCTATDQPVEVRYSADYYFWTASKPRV